MDNNLKKAYFWNTIGSGFNSFNSLFFLIIVTRINGIKEAGIFTFCFATAAMLYIIALYSGRTYQVTETNDNIGDNEFIMHRFISSLIMLVISILFSIVNHYSLFKVSIFLLLCLFRCTEAICDVFHGIMQKNNKLDIVGKSLTIRSFLDIIIFLIIDIIFKNLILSCIALIITNLFVLFFIDLRFFKNLKKEKKSINYSMVLKIFSFGFFTFGFTFVANYLVNAPRYALDALMDEEFQTVFGIIVMPASIIMLINQFVIQPVINLLKSYYQEKNKKRFLSLVYKIIFVTILTGTLALIFSKLIGIPVLNFMYNIKLNSYLNNLLVVIFGATLYTIASVFSNALIVLRKTKVQLLIYVLTSIFAFVISYTMVKSMGFDGATYSYLFTMILLLILYWMYFTFIISKKELWKSGENNE